MQDSQKNNKKKILFVITKSVWGGAGKYVYDLATNLPKDKFDVRVAAAGEGELVQKSRQAGIVCYNIKNFQRDIGVLKDIAAFFEILKLLYRFKPDIINTNSSKAGGIVGAASFIYKLQRSLAPLKLIFTAHGWAFNENRPKWQIFLIKFFSRLTVLFYAQIICVSKFDRQAALKNKIAPAKKLITIHNGIDAAQYKFLTKEEARQNLKSQISNLTNISQNSKLENLFLIGTVGEFTRNKGQEYLIEAVSKLSTVNCQLSTVIVGWGEEISNLKSQISNLGLEDRVFVIEGLSPAAPCLKAFDIFILPSLKEGLPYTLLEAGLAELPVIATNVGGNPEIIENRKTGLLVNPANAEELAEALKNLIDAPELAKILASNLHKKILQRFSLEKMVMETLKVYTSIFNN